MRKTAKKEIPDPKYIGVPNISFSLTDKNDSREKSFKRQRVKNGFDDSETWSLYTTIINFVLPRLKRFEQVTIGYPDNMTDKQWHIILNKIIGAFELILKDDELYIDSDDWIKVQEGLQLFSKHFINLWW